MPIVAEPPVTLDEARKAFYVIEQCEPDVLLSEAGVSLEIIGDYLHQQVPDSILKFESVSDDKLRAENNYLRARVDALSDSAIKLLQVERAIARGYVATDFFDTVAIWAQ